MSSVQDSLNTNMYQTNPLGKEGLFGQCNIRSLVGNYLPTAASKLMLVSKILYSQFKPDIDSTCQAAPNISQFKSVLTEADQQKSSMEQLGQLVGYAKMHMSYEQYNAIKQKYRISKIFFAKLADQIQVNQGNKDHATLALANTLRQKGLSLPEGGVEVIRAWFNDPNNRAVIQGIDRLNLQSQNLKVLPDELSLFTGLQDLNLNHNQLTSIGVSGLPQLWWLHLSNNHLKSVDVSELPKLQKLDLNDNQLTSIDVSGLAELQELWLYNNCLASVDVSELPKLQELDLSDNELTSIDVSGLPQLHYLNLSDNELTSIDVSGLPQLKSLYLSDNELTSIDVSGLAELQTLVVSRVLTLLGWKLDKVTYANDPRCSPFYFYIKSAEVS